MAIYPSSMKGVPYPLLVASTTGTGTPVTIPITANNIRIVVTGASTISGGVLTIEEAGIPDYTGTWSAITTVTGTTLTGGAQQVIHITGTIGAIRARVTTTITGGGNIAADLVSN